MAFSHSFCVNFSGFAPTVRSMKPIVSRISVSSVTLPLRSERVRSSVKLFTSLVLSAL